MKPPPKTLVETVKPVTADELRTLSGDITGLLAERGSAWGPLLGQRPAVIAFDVGKFTAYCSLFPLGAPPEVNAWMGGGIDPVWTRKVQGALDMAVHRVRRGDASALLVAVEDTFVHRASPNIATASGLSRYVGGVSALAALYGLPVVRVMASSWQGALLGKVRRDQGKQLSIARARQYVSREIHNEHMADAANLAWFVHMGRAAK